MVFYTYGGGKGREFLQMYQALKSQGAKPCCSIDAYYPDNYPRLPIYPKNENELYTIARS